MTTVEEAAEQRRFRALMIPCAATLLVLDVVLAHAVRLTISGLWLPTVPVCFGAIAAALYCGKVMPRLAISFELLCFSEMLGTLIGILVKIAARTPAATVDAMLARSDAAMGASTEAMVRWAAGMPWMRHGLELAYMSMDLCVVIIVLGLPVFGRARAARRFIVATVMASIVAAAVFAIMPAVGPWTMNPHLVPSGGQRLVAQHVADLKGTNWVDAGVQDGGVVAFPSFHTCLAITVAVAFGSLRRLQLPAWLLAVAVAMSTMTTGWHYATDVLAGCVVGTLSVLSAGWLLRTRPVRSAEPSLLELPVVEAAA